MALTFTEITKRMIKFRSPEQYVPGQVRTLKSTPYIGTKSIQHQALVKGQTGEYSVIVQFYDVEFVEEKLPGYIPVKVKLKAGDKLYYYKPPSLKKNPVALKCFTGDTLVCLADGHSVPIKSLEGKQEFYVYSYDAENKKVVIGKGRNCRKIEKQSSLVRVTFDNGNSIRCTPDHKFLMKDGIYKEAQNLDAGDSIEPLEDSIDITTLSPKVTSVESLDEKEDTYCFTVDKYHNFAIDIGNGVDCSSGVFVKNCSGPDFRFRFEYALSKVKSLIGPFRKYTKVPGSTRPPVNPDDIPGYDKHIRTLVNALLQARMVVE